MMSSVATVLMVGAVGASVSTLMTRVPAVLTLPAASVWVTERVTFSTSVVMSRLTLVGAVATTATSKRVTLG